MKVLILCLLALAAVTIPSRAQVVNAASCAESDVHKAFASVDSNTTTVNIPACPNGVQWSGNELLTVQSNNFSLLCAGSQTTTGGGDQTVILDGVSTNENPILVVNVASTNGTFRIAGCTFKDGSIKYNSATNEKYDGLVQINATSTRIRADHNHFNTSASGSSMIEYQGCAYGPVDHSIFDGGDVTNAVRVYNSGSCNGDSLGVGDQSWAMPTSLGSANFLFIEDNIFNGGASNDCTKGGRFVSRFNTFNAAAPAPTVQTHPTGGGERERGCRAWEVYNNKFVATGYINAGFWVSSGTGVFWGNIFNASAVGGGTGYQNILELLPMRQNADTYPQAPTPQGWGYAGTSFNSSANRSAWDGDPNTASGYPNLDQPGRGMGQLLVNDFPNVLNASTGTIAWPNQALEPIYEWNTTDPEVPDNPSNLMANGGVAGTFTPNVDYYLGTKEPSQGGGPIAFNGSVGVGSGTLASRPTSCTKGVAYWATDQGNWNLSGSGGQGQLYTCTATGSPGTWTLFYTPYTYPHPLVSGGGSATPVGVTLSGSISVTTF